MTPYPLSRKPILKFSPTLPTELWAMIFDIAVSNPAFFENRWEYGYIAPFDEASHSLSPQESYLQSLATKRAILLVSKRWNIISHGLMFRQLVIRGREQLDTLVMKLEASAKDVAAGGLRRVPMGWHVTHVKLLVTAEAPRAKEILRANVHRLVTCCPRLSVLMDAAPYGLREPPESYPSAEESICVPAKSRLQSLVWSYGGPSIPEFSDAIMQQIFSIQATTIHFPPIAELESFTPITLPNLTCLSLSISWNNHLPWRLAAEHLILPSLRHLIVRAPLPGDAALTTESVHSLDAFLEVHGGKLDTLDIRVTPRCAGRQSLLFLHEGSMENVMDPGAMLARCPNLTELALSARWLPAEEEHVEWHHARLERVGLRDVDPDAGGDLSAPSRAIQMIASYQRSANFFDWSVETLLQAGPSAELSKRHQSFATTMRTLLGARPMANCRSNRESKEMAFPAVRSIRLLDARASTFRDGAKSTEDGVFWEGWRAVSTLRGVHLSDGCGAPIPSSV